MTAKTTALPLIPVEFQYNDTEGVANRNFRGICCSVPRVGEHIYANPDSEEFTIVWNVSYKFFKVNEDDEEFQQQITVWLRDAREDDRDQAARAFVGR